MYNGKKVVSKWSLEELQHYLGILAKTSRPEQRKAFLLGKDKML